LPAIDQEQNTASLQEIQRAVAVVWVLNLVPFLGLGFLYAARLRGLPVLFFLWMAELAWFKGGAIVPLYFILSVLGTFVVVIDRRKLTVDEMLRPLQDEPATTDDTNLANEGAEQRRDRLLTDTTIDPGGDHSDFALSSFDRKLQAAEKQLAARPQNNDQDDYDVQAGLAAAAPSRSAVDPTVSAKAVSPDPTGQFVGSQSESAAEAAVFGPDPFAGNVVRAAGDPANTTSSSGSITVPAAATGSSSATGFESSLEQPIQNAQPQSVVSAEQTAYAAVRADTMGDAAKSADQVTSQFAAENAGATADFLDTSAQAEAANLIQPDPNSAKMDALAAIAGAVQVNIPSPEFTPSPGLGEIPGLGVYGFESSLGVVPTLPPLTGDPLSSSLVSEVASGEQSQFGSATAGGAEAAPAAKCPKCGADLHGQFSFCLSCLSPL
jgi:hypothetical protein